MLNSLIIRDILLIDHLELEFERGLNVLTGETGAGKSILLDCLGFVLGWRGRADLVRQTASQGEVTAVFSLTKGDRASKLLAEAGLPHGDELVLRRTNARDGRKTAFVNDRRVSTEVMRALSEVLVELHGQHDDKGLLNRRTHLDALDQFANIDRVSLSTAYNAWRKSENALNAAKEQIAKAAADRDYLNHVVTELEEFGPEVGEEERLDSERRLMQASVKIREDIARAYDAITGPEGAEARLTDVTRWLEGASEQAEGQLDQSLLDLAQTIDNLALVETGVRECLEALNFDPALLERTEERLFTYRDLARKHNILPNQLNEKLETLRARLDVVIGGEDRLTRMQSEADELKNIYQDLANRASEIRKSAALHLEKAMMKELAPLKMDRASFEVKISDASPSISGIDAVAFEAATNPGAPSGPIDKVASGGELSRFLLALKVALTSDASGLTMIFDEIDRGVGGATADAVGRRLQDLSNTAQLLVVTHSPQVASLGNAHWRVSKHIRSDMTLSRVERLSEHGRLDEVARMLAGEHITDAARQAARALIEQA